ncbi:MAG: hypothetical protein R3Y54_07730 [Eubacteriales bacterium]
MNISTKTDYSTLFSSMNSNLDTNSMSGLMSSINFSDLASIKNGTYKMALDSYYSSQESDSSSSSSFTDTSSSFINNATLSTTDQAALSKYQNVETATSDLVASAETLASTTNNSLFGGDSLDMEAVYEEVSSFVNSYNDMMSEGSTSSTFINSQVSSLSSLTDTYSSSLASIGITINSDNTLSIDEDQFKSSSSEAVTSVFNGSTSYASQVGERASFINYLADKEVNSTSSYSVAGTYENSFTSGSLFDSFF